MLITSAIHFVQLFLRGCKSTRGWVWLTCSCNMQSTTSSRPPPRPPVTKKGRSWLAAAGPELAAPPAPFPCPPRAGRTSRGPGEAAGGITSIWAEGSLPGQAEPRQRSKSSAAPTAARPASLCPSSEDALLCSPSSSAKGRRIQILLRNSNVPDSHPGELGDFEMPCTEKGKAVLPSFSTLLEKALPWEIIAFRLLVYL